MNRKKIKKSKISDRYLSTIGESALGVPPRESKIICNYCSQVVDVRISEDEYYCNTCQITIIPSIQDVRRVQDLEVPQGVSEETLIVHPPEPHEQDVRIRKGPVVKGGLKALQNKGLKITSYTSTEKEEEREEY